MKRLLQAVVLLFALINCAAQQTFPLRTDFTEVPNYSYLKDTDNQLSKYTGEYKAYYNGNEIILYIIKKDHVLFENINNKYYRDILSITFIVKDASGQVLQDTTRMGFNPNQRRHTIYSWWAEPEDARLLLYYGGTNCGVGAGTIQLDKISASQLSWDYRPGNTITNSDTCPPNTDLTVYLPATKGLIFTKQ